MSIHPLPQSPLVVCQVVPRLESGGVERGTVDMALALEKSAHRAIVVSGGGRMVYELARANVKHITLPVYSKNPWIIYKNARRLRKLIKQEKINILHARSRAPAWSCLLATQKLACAFITTYHGTYNAKTFLKKWYNSIMVRSKAVIAISDFIYTHVIEKYGAQYPRLSQKITLIPRGIDLQAFDPQNISSSRIIQLARTWDLPDGLPIILLPGRLTRWKGQLIIIEAIHHLKQLLPNQDVCCLLIGDHQGNTHFQKELETLIYHYQLENSVRIVDHCVDMPAAYMLGDIVVSASIEPEAFGRVIAEGLAMGRLVVATNHGGAREIVPSGSGWLVKPKDPQDLAKALAEAILLPLEKRRTMTQTGQAWVREKFNKSIMVESTLNLYKIHGHPLKKKSF